MILRLALRLLRSALAAVLGAAALAGVLALALVALLPAPAERPSWAVPEHPLAEEVVVGVTARAYLLREAARDSMRAAAPAPAETTSPPPPGPPAAPASPPPGDPARPIVPAALRFAPPGWPQEIEQGYLELLRVRAAALLSLDPSALGAVATGPALEALTAEVEGRRQDLRPARLAVHQDILVVYRDQRYTPTLLASYWDDSAPVDPWTGEALPRPEPPELVRETLTFERQDGVWKVVGLSREVIGFLGDVAPGGGEPHPREAIPLRDRLDGVLAQAYLTLDAGRLPEVLAGAALAAGVEEFAGLRGGAAVLRWEAQPALVDTLLVVPSGALLLDEVYLDAGVWLDRRTRRPLPSSAPVYRRRRLVFEQVEGTWKCVEWRFWSLGQPLS